MRGDAPDERRIAAEIEERVRSGRLGPGDRLTVGPGLAARFGMDVALLRSAVRVLEDSGLIRLVPGEPDEVEILPFSTTALRRAIARLAAMETLGLADLVRFRILLEGWAYQLAARRASPADLAELDEALAAMAAAVPEGPAAFAVADVAFHRVMARASGDEMLQVCHEAVRDVVTGLISHRLTTAGGRPELLVKALDLHVDLLAAVRAGDGEAASRLARRSMRVYLSAMADEGERARPALVAPLATTSADDVLELLDVAADTGAPLWLNGGWAVDALLGAQTRQHGDVDVVVPVEHAAGLVVALAERGYAARPGARAENIVLGDPRGRAVDVHVVELDEHGNGWHGPTEVYPAAALTGAAGTIAGRAVRCIAPQWLVQFHTGYRVDVDDWHDVAALCDRFDLPVPPDYARFRASGHREGLRRPPRS
ncbi:DNA-binding transcriptional regulator, FadR family [Pseudonocardia thermophila]|uniref:DNA-binding transcriptional regulator, FadR family n=1 Tax=Pseudonocardia thermophila TaxID=1848 RepID=A0A1M6TYP4_PSETH|nr:FCD domain-containing protein [Pseudonocardia thermophila]SHK62087.1 DNA-binding transcriptional regulator, FadR family [Pseudonocardia thermophila]